jgi:translation initiation factor IF-1
MSDELLKERDKVVLLMADYKESKGDVAFFIK